MRIYESERLRLQSVNSSILLRTQDWIQEQTQRQRAGTGYAELPWKTVVSVLIPGHIRACVSARENLLHTNYTQEQLPVQAMQHYTALLCCVAS